MPSNEEGGITISLNLVVLGVKDLCFCVKKGAICVYRVSLNFESGTTKSIDQRVDDVATRQVCDGPDEN